MRRQLPVSVVAVLLSTSSPVLAQYAPSFDAPPMRIANIYDWRRHQPTRRQVDAAKAAAGVPHSARNWREVDQVEEEVAALLKQTDELDNQANNEAYSKTDARASR